MHFAIAIHLFEFWFAETSPEKILKCLKDLNPSIAASIDNLSGKFLKDGADT